MLTALLVTGAALAASLAPAGANGLEVQDEVVGETGSCVPELSMVYEDQSDVQPGLMAARYAATFWKSECPLWEGEHGPEPLVISAELTVSYRHRPWLTSLPWQHEPTLAVLHLEYDNFYVWEVLGEGQYHVTSGVGIGHLIEDQQTQFRLDVTVFDTENLGGLHYSTGWIDGPNMPEVNERFEERPDDFTLTPGQRHQ